MDIDSLIQCDDADTIRALRDLLRVVLDAGGHLHPGLRVVVDADGALGIESDAPDGELLARLPTACLIPVGPVELGVGHDDRLEIRRLPDDYDPTHRALLDSMLAIYNRTRKVSAHRLSCPWLAFATDAELLRKLASGRADALKHQHYVQMALEGRSEDIVVRSFLGSRVLSGKIGVDSPHEVLMPVIDFFDHHPACSPFGAGADALSVVASHPLPGSRRCMVSYSRLDALDAFLNYGFADTAAPYVRSVAFEVELPGLGVLQVKSRMTRVRDEPLPAGLEPLQFWLPRFQKEQDRLVSEEWLIPPATHRSLLQNVAVVLVQQLAPRTPAATIRQLAPTVVRRLIEVNQVYYDGLRELAEQSPRPAGAGAELQRVIAHAQRLLSGYPVSPEIG